MTITTGTFPKGLREGVYAFMHASAKKEDSPIDKIYRKKASKKSYEEFVNTISLSFVPTKPEGSPIQQDTPSQGYTVRVQHFTKALAFSITEEAFEDNQYESLSKMRGAMLGKSFFETRQIEGHVPLNNAPIVNLGDGVPLLSPAHPSKVGNQSNTLDVGQTMSEAAFEQLITRLRTNEEEAGKKTNLKPISLIYHTNNDFNVERIMKSQLQNDTANNATNALRTMYGNLKLISTPYLSNTGHYGFQTDVDDHLGFIHFERRPFRSLSKSDDGNTNNMVFYGSERYSFVTPNYRCYFGYGGA